MATASVLVSDVLKLASAHFEANRVKYGIDSLFRFGTYETALRQFFGHKRADELTTGDLDAFAKNHQITLGSVDWVCHREIFFLARAYDLALAQGLVTKRVSITGQNSEDYFTREEFERQVAALKDYAKDLTTFAYITGRSQGEIFNLKWDTNYDTDRQAMIYGTRVIPLELFDGLRELVERRLAKRVDGCPWVFHKDGKQIFNNSFNWEWRRACKVSGVNRDFRELRLAAARNLKIAGYEPKQVIQITGYTKPIPVTYRYEITTVSKAAPARSKVYGLPREPQDPKRTSMTKAAFKSTEGDKDLFEMADFYARGLARVN